MVKPPVSVKRETGLNPRTLLRNSPSSSPASTTSHDSSPFLRSAARVGSVDNLVTALLLFHGGNAKTMARAILDANNVWGHSPLYNACLHGHVSCARLMVSVCVFAFSCGGGAATEEDDGDGKSGARTLEDWVSRGPLSSRLKTPALRELDCCRASALNDGIRRLLVSERHARPTGLRAALSKEGIVNGENQLCSALRRAIGHGADSAFAALGKSYTHWALHFGLDEQLRSAIIESKYLQSRVKMIDEIIAGLDQKVGRGGRLLVQVQKKHPTLNNNPIEDIYDFRDHRFEDEDEDSHDDDDSDDDSGSCYSSSGYDVESDAVSVSVSLATSSYSLCGAFSAGAVPSEDESSFLEVSSDDGASSFGDGAMSEEDEWDTREFDDEEEDEKKEQEEGVADEEAAAEAESSFEKEGKPPRRWADVVKVAPPPPRPAASKKRNDKEQGPAAIAVVAIAPTPDDEEYDAAKSMMGGRAPEWCGKTSLHKRTGCRCCCTRLAVAQEKRAARKHLRAELARMVV